MIEGEMFIFESKDQSNTIKIISAPEDALIAHTFWFAWAAYEPDTEIYKAQ